MNIGPQPNGELPAVALDRLKELGEWTSAYGETIYGTEAGDIKPQKWGVSTQKDDKLYLHITALDQIEKDENGQRVLHLPLKRKVKSVTEFIGGAKVKFNKYKECIVIPLPEKVDVVDYVLVLQQNGNLRVSESINKVYFDYAEREQVQDDEVGLKVKTENCE